MFCIDGMIDATELSTVMNILKLPITDREANEMIEFADHDKGNIHLLDISIIIFRLISKRFFIILR
jgi:Ca2+-binding EF-hand superfamily protein